MSDSRRRRQPRRNESVSSYDSEYSAPRHRRRGRGHGSVPPAQAQDQVPGSKEWFAGNHVTGPMGGAVESVSMRAAHSQEGNQESLKLCLEINLDVAVEIKARVHGDVTLSLLS